MNLFMAVVGEVNRDMSLVRWLGLTNVLLDNGRKDIGVIRLEM